TRSAAPPHTSRILAMVSDRRAGKGRGSSWGKRGVVTTSPSAGGGGVSASVSPSAASRSPFTRGGASRRPRRTRAAGPPSSQARPRARKRPRSTFRFRATEPDHHRAARALGAGGSRGALSLEAFPLQPGSHASGGPDAPDG